MNIRRIVSSAAVAALMLFAALPARAGIPVFDGAAFAQLLAQIQAWGKQWQQMDDSYNRLKDQLKQMQTMTDKIDGARSLGSILNDPNIQAALPAEMNDATQLLLNPAGTASSQAQLNQILALFGVQSYANTNAGQAAADTLGRAQQILTATQLRATQLQKLAQRVDAAADAKESLDLVNRNVLETATINNQMMQTLAALEAARQSAELKRLADNQAYFDRVKAAGAKPLQTFSY